LGNPILPSTGFADEQGVVMDTARNSILKKKHGRLVRAAQTAFSRRTAFALHLCETNRLIGKFLDTGPQTDFYLPDPWLYFGDKENTLSIRDSGSRRQTGQAEKKTFIASVLEHDDCR